MRVHFVRPVAIVLAAGLLAAQLGGCASTPGPSGESGGVTQAGQGVAIGALVGALVGSAATIRGDRTKAAFLGALVGAAVGGAIGDYRDRQTATRAQAAQRYGPGADRLVLEGATVMPQAVRAGAAVESSVQYTTLSADAGSQVTVRETRRLVASDDSAVPLGDRQVVRAQGSHRSSIRFTMPAGIPPGSYRLVTTISDGQQSRTVERALQVI